MNNDNMMMEPEQFAGIPSAEQETTISYCRTEPGAEIWTNDRTVMTKLDKLAKESPEFYKLKETGRTRSGQLLYKVYTMTDKSMISFRSKKVTRELTEEQRQAMRERGRMLRAGQLAQVRDKLIPTNN